MDIPKTIRGKLNIIAALWFITILCIKGFLVTLPLMGPDARLGAQTLLVLMSTLGIVLAGYWTNSLLRFQKFGEAIFAAVPVFGISAIMSLTIQEGFFPVSTLWPICIVLMWSTDHMGGPKEKNESK